MMLIRLAAVDRVGEVDRWRAVTWDSEPGLGHKVEIYKDTLVRVLDVVHLMHSKAGVEVRIEAHNCLARIHSDPAWKTSREEADKHRSFQELP